MRQGTRRRGGYASKAGFRVEGKTGERERSRNSVEGGKKKSLTGGVTTSKKYFHWFIDERDAKKVKKQKKGGSI